MKLLENSKHLSLTVIILFKRLLFVLYDINYVIIVDI